MIWLNNRYIEVGLRYIVLSGLVIFYRNTLGFTQGYLNIVLSGLFEVMHIESGKVGIVNNIEY